MSILKHKVLDILESFSKDDIKNFRKFISYSFHTNGRNYLPLLNEIIRYVQGKEQIHTSKLYSSLYKEKKFSKQTLKNRLTELFKLAEEFLVFRRLESLPFEKDKLLLQEYLEKNLLKLFESKYKNANKNLDSMPDSDSKFRNIFFLKGINLSILESKNTVDILDRQFYDRSVYSLCLFLIDILLNGIEFKLKEYNNRVIEPNIIESAIKNLHIETYVESFKKSELAIQKLVCMHFYLYKAFDCPEDDHYYFEMRKIFKEISKSFSDEYKEGIYKLIINYCTLRQNSGVKKFQLELFSIYNEKLKQGLYSEFRQKNFPVNTFRDYVLIGIEIKKYEWVEEFIKKYSAELHPEIREDEVSLSYGRLYFDERDFEKSLLYLNKIQGLNYLHYTDAAVLRMCCYFEFNRLESCFYELDKFRHYIRNHKEMPEIHKIPNLNFAKIYQAIISNKSRAEKRDLGFLADEVRSLKFISKGKWLLEKIRN